MVQWREVILLAVSRQLLRVAKNQAGSDVLVYSVGQVDHPGYSVASVAGLTVVNSHWISNRSETRHLGTSHVRLYPPVGGATHADTRAVAQLTLVLGSEYNRMNAQGLNIDAETNLSAPQTTPEPGPWLQGENE